ncbi:MAG: 2-iminoacetate synthase ThiH [Planctomycetes bacterium]|nr:2-iminoacetate synthase ThiH [Planctomycetota bacterium]
MTTTTGKSVILDALAREGLDHYSPEMIGKLSSYTADDVRRELAKPIAPFSLERLKTFISPAAAGCLEEMAQASMNVTRQRFGNTMNMYAPLYVSNYCINRCKYCGFNATHGGERCRLTIEQAEAEARIIAKEGFRDLLLVAGEDPNYVTVEYLSELSRRLRGLFSSISIEVNTMDKERYTKLFEAGIDGVTIYQETYDRELYDEYHLGGPKKDYENRIAAQESCGRAGMRKLGIGALLGLQDWRFEILALGVHAHELIKLFWRSKVSISFPRMRPAQDVQMNFPHLVSDRELVQMILALRLTFPDAALVLSTRESAEFRNNVIPLGITQISAGSKTNPGGYAEEGESSEQFVVADTRMAAEVSEYLKSNGFDPVWKDWDTGFHG